jgi:tetratricopeptide (TPR) repeat protein
MIFSMKRTPYLCSGGLVKCVVLGCLAVGIAAAPLRAGEQSRNSDGLPVKPQVEKPEASKKELLADLFARLREAPDKDSAELVAEAIDKIWMRSGSDTVDLLMSRALQMLQDKNFDVAIDILDSVVEIAPTYPEGWNQRATVFFLKRDFRRSLDDLRHVLALEPRHFKALNGLGLIMQEIGDKEAALKAFRHVLKLYPQLGETRQLEKELTREVEGQGI